MRILSNFTEEIRYENGLNASVVLETSVQQNNSNKNLNSMRLSKAIMKVVIADRKQFEIE